MGGVLDVAGLVAHLSGRDGALIALDLGTRTLGVAISDAGRRLAQPLTVLRRTRFTADTDVLLRMAAERQAVGFVIGLPLNMDGSEGPRAQSARAFARHFAPRTPLPLLLIDERLSSFEAGERLRAAGASRRSREARLDAVAAAVILETALAALADAQSAPLTPRPDAPG